MFDLELFELIKKLKENLESKDSNELENVQMQIYNLISSNPEKFVNFIQTNPVSYEIEKYLEDIYNKYLQSQKVNQNVDNLNSKNSTLTEDIGEESNSKQILKIYSQWLKEYRNQNNTVLESQIKYIEEYVSNLLDNNKLYVLEEILKINETQDFEVFKNILRNLMRKYYAKKIENFYKSERVQSLGFFKKKILEKKIFSILDDIGRYRFNEKQIREVLS